MELQALEGSYYDTQIIAADIAAHVSSDPRAPVHNLQRRWTTLLDQTSRTSRLAAAGGVDDDAKARLASCAMSHEAEHPIVPLGVRFDWLSNPQYTAWCRLWRSGKQGRTQRDTGLQLRSRS